MVISPCEDLRTSGGINEGSFVMSYQTWACSELKSG